MERPTCGTCPYWESNRVVDHDVGGSLCLCRRYPPQFDPQSKEPLSYMWEIEWCGEHPDFPAYITSLKRLASVKKTIEEIPWDSPTYLGVRGFTALKKALEKHALSELTIEKLLAIKGCGISTADIIMKAVEARLSDQP